MKMTSGVRYIRGRACYVAAVSNPAETVREEQMEQDKRKVRQLNDK